MSPGPTAGLEPVLHPHVLVVDVDVHVAVQLAVGREELALGLRVLAGEPRRTSPTVRAVDLRPRSCPLTDGPQHGWDLHGRHRGGKPTLAAGRV